MEKTHLERRQFIKTIASAAGAAACGGCATAFGKEPFYGPTIRDRLWMWGHHPAAVGIAGWGFAKHGFKTGFVDQAEGCRLMGIPNNCVIRCAELPKRPWGDYFEQFRALKRFTFGITDGGIETTEEKMRISFEELKPSFPNFTGCFLDDFFRPADIGQKGISLREVSDEVHAHGLRLSVVLYSDQDGFQEKFKRDLELCDETSLWFWKSANIETMGDQVKRCRDFIGPEKDLLLGLYMWDFDKSVPVPAARMAQQLAFARSFLADRTVTGLVFHPSFAAALDVPAVKLAREWIAAYADDRWGAS